MGAVQGLIELCFGLCIIAVVFVLLEPCFVNISLFSQGMGGFAASVDNFIKNCVDSAFLLIVGFLGINAILQAMGITGLSDLVTQFTSVAGSKKK